MNDLERSDRLHALRLPAFFAGVGVALLVLPAAGEVLPPVPGGSDLWTFVQRTDPLVVCFTVLRLVALVLCWYLLTTTLLGLAARLTRVAVLIRATDVVTLPSVRRLVRGVAGVSLATSVGAAGIGGTALVIAAPALTAQAEGGGPTMRVLDDPTATAPRVTMRELTDAAPPPGDANAVTGASVPTMRVVEPPAASTPSSTPMATPALTTGSSASPTTTPPPIASAPTTPPATAPASPPTMRTDETPPPPAAVAAAPDPAPASPIPPATWTIAPGDHLWHVSQATLQTAWGRAPSDAETASYLQRLIDGNAGVFAVPGNADLVFPGQVFSLPSP